MKREFLESLELGEGAKLPKTAIEAIMAEHGKTKGALDNTLATITTERDGLKNQLETATAAIKSYEGMDVESIKTAAKTWEEKYNKDTKTLQEQLDSANYDFAVKEATAGIQFTSESAHKAFVADLTAKKLPVQDGKLLGMEDFVKVYQTGDPGAFVPEGEDKTPTFTKGLGGGSAMGADAALRAAMGLPDKKE